LLSPLVIVGVVCVPSALYVVTVLLPTLLELDAAQLLLDLPSTS
jgi:hypothetical protein